jgi:hypothetical protein
MNRAQLPNRRPAISFDVEHAGARYRMQVGYFPDGSPGEVFLNARKQNSALDAFAADGAILISLCLQYGASPQVIAKALRRTPSGQPATIIGAAADRLLPQTADEP